MTSTQSDLPGKDKYVGLQYIKAVCGGALNDMLVMYSDSGAPNKAIFSNFYIILRII